MNVDAFFSFGLQCVHTEERIYGCWADSTIHIEYTLSLFAPPPSTSIRAKHTHRRSHEYVCGSIRILIHEPLLCIKFYHIHSSTRETNIIQINYNMLFLSLFLCLWSREKQFKAVCTATMEILCAVLCIQFLFTILFSSSQQCNQLMRMSRRVYIEKLVCPCARQRCVSECSYSREIKPQYLIETRKIFCCFFCISFFCQFIWNWNLTSLREKKSWFFVVWRSFFHSPLTNRMCSKCSHKVNVFEIITILFFAFVRSFLLLCFGCCWRCLLLAVCHDKWFVYFCSLQPPTAYMPKVTSILGWANIEKYEPVLAMVEGKNCENESVLCVHF